MFTKTILADTEDIWNDLFSKYDSDYREPGMVLFSDAVRNACGGASAAVGPFYCLSDEKVYMDLRFFDEQLTRFGAKEGDFAIAMSLPTRWAIIFRTLPVPPGRCAKHNRTLGRGEANKLSVALELQADFYAGVWAHHNKKYQEEGSIEIALSAASAVGDDAIQKRTSGTIVPDAFTHGTSRQGMEWLKRGYQSGDISQGDTFTALLN